MPEQTGRRRLYETTIYPSVEHDVSCAGVGSGFERGHWFGAGIRGRDAKYAGSRFERPPLAQGDGTGASAGDNRRSIRSAAPEPVNPTSLQGRGPLDEFGQPRGAGPQAPGLAPPAGRFPDSIPDRLTIKPGAYLTVRVDQPLSSDHNQPGDAFTATLVKPLVVDGVVVMQRGQTIAGAVAEAQKAGRVQGVSRLGVHVTELTLVDGQQVPVRTQLISRTGPTSHGSDAGAIAATTATGAAIGAMADWGTGAAIGAGAGAVAGLVGVLLTRGHETLIAPEMLLTFRVEAPVTVVTARAPQAFRYVEPEDYAKRRSLRDPLHP